MANSNLTAQRLRELLHYDPATGLFTRRVRTTNSVQIGDVAGWKTRDGRWSVHIFGHDYLAHRLAWFYSTDNWPKDEIDHINGDPLDNRLANLREATGAQNKQNQRRAKSNNRSSGLLGVTWNRKLQKWMAQIQTNGRNQYLGYFRDPELAHAAYLDTKRKAHEFGTI